ncbi:MAG: hypothetical protein HY762_01115, partial [Planctomycetes bacterium]|nr:hypothetical protein [Planctomycetota bacterium]
MTNRIWVKIGLLVIILLSGVFILGSSHLYAADPPPTARFLVRPNVPSYFPVTPNEKIAIPYN